MIFSFQPGKRLLLDGATGTAMLEAGMPQGACTETWILEHPEVITSLQKAYADAGSDLVYAPTFGANRAALARHGLDEKVLELNQKLVALSKEAVGGRCAVAGDMSPTSLFLQPAGDATFQDIYDIYAEQAQALFQAGADLIAIETMTSLAEARIALLAAKEKTPLPVIVTVTVDASGHTMSGNSALACLTVLQGLGADAFGFNCSTGPDEMLELFQEIAPYAHIPLIAKPNAGLPQIVDGKTVFDCGPVPFAALGKALLAAGADILGGCCGTTAEHIALLRTALSEAPPAAIEKDTETIVAATEREAMFIHPLTDISPALECSEDLAEDILEAEDEYGVINIAFSSLEDIEVFTENSYMIKSPLALSAPTADLLALAARQFPGRAMYDSSDSIEDDVETGQLAAIVKKYGLIQL